MSRGVRIRVQAHEAVQTAMDDVDSLLCSLTRHTMGDRIVDCSDHVAKDAVLVFSVRWWPRVENGWNARTGLRIGSGDIAVAPGRPEAVHWPSIAGCSESSAGIGPKEANYFRCGCFRRRSTASKRYTVQWISTDRK